MKYKQIDKEERKCIAAYLNEGKTPAEIAEILNRPRSTISREIKRNSTNKGYNPVTAQKKYRKRRRNCVPKNKLEANQEIYDKVIIGLELYFSPEQIHNTICKEVGISTIYRAIKKKIIPKKYMYKFRRFRIQTGPKKGSKQKNKPCFRPIIERAKEVEKREEFGHWELDTVMFHRKTKKCIATMVERKTRFTIINLMPDYSAKSMMKAIISELGKFPANMRKTITTDRGREFTCWQKVEDALKGTKLYATDPQRPYQKGTVENTNGLIRQFFPKHHYKGEPSQNQISAVNSLLNLRPRKCLNFSSPSQVFFNESICCS